MGLSDWLSERAARRAHALVVEAPGHSVTAMGVERACVARGWRLATAPADADVLVVCGSPGPQLSGIVDALWAQLPGPRARVDVASWSDVDPALEEGERYLRDTARQRHDGEHRPVATPEAGATASMDHEGMDREGMDREGMDREGMDREGMDREDMDHADMDHEDMDHGGMEMAPEGIPLAKGGEDRDGLEMDVLHVRLGPVLAHWPGGLVLRCALQGDVVAEATVEVIDVDGLEQDEASARRSGPMYAAQRCHRAAQLLALAGWADGAARARAIRDALLDAAGAGDRSGEVDLGALSDSVMALRRRVAASRFLRWSLRGLGALGDDDVERHRLPERLRGDVRDRLLGMLDRADDVLSRAGRPVESGDRQVPLSAVGVLVTGLDLAAARLVVASLDLDVAMISRRDGAHV